MLAGQGSHCDLRTCAPLRGSHPLSCGCETGQGVARINFSLRLYGDDISFKKKTCKSQCVSKHVWYGALGPRLVVGGGCEIVACATGCETIARTEPLWWLLSSNLCVNVSGIIVFSWFPALLPCYVSLSGVVCP